MVLVHGITKINKPNVKPTAPKGGAISHPFLKQEKALTANEANLSRRIFNI